MAVDLIRYDLLVQEALRGVLRSVLSGIARDGLPGEHHFYISFRTHAQGVRLSQRMRDLYPDEMTIVLQHQFWDLSVSEHAFEVGLSFQHRPEILLVPFEAVTRFADPTVGFELSFGVEEGVAPAQPRPEPASSHESLPPTPLSPEEGTARERKTESDISESAPDEKEASEGEPKVVSIDAFRKKS
jgi:uncharacterized protein